MVGIECPRRGGQYQACLARRERLQTHPASHIHAFHPHVPMRLLPVVPQKPCGETKAPVLAATIPVPDTIIIVEQTLKPAVLSTHRRWVLLPSPPRAMLVCVYVVVRRKRPGCQEDGMAWVNNSISDMAGKQQQLCVVAD